ncbi:MAG: transcriptional repressor [Sphaerochaetaceae bacterium]|jgi:Fe2+ or Zn2+ uptake regulation protein|nr:transcriptional repressor [Sphaerochaetaceae bacterium]MDD4219551.1 transcriptional repressor [Sphaerochaetaceae bacterium]MDY0371719.1 transcriptional repressor [Sphaerochaetaceae bacterium]
MTKKQYMKPGAEKKVLLEHGVRPLKHRVAVYRYLLDNPIHPTADTIYSELKNNMSSISRTTVYNVLNLLCSHNVVQEIAIEKNEMRYDANVTNHIHFKCFECGHVYDLHDVTFPTIAVPSGFRIDAVQINMTGLCPNCS